MARSSPLLLLLLGACADVYTVYFPDVDLRPPDDLEARVEAYRSGAETWHDDARAVADVAIRRYLDVPWKASPFQGQLYTVKHRDDWGTFVVRGYTYPSGGVVRYRVKVRRYKEIWYAVQVSHFKDIEVPDERDDPHRR